MKAVEKICYFLKSVGQCDQKQNSCLVNRGFKRVHFKAYKPLDLYIYYFVSFTLKFEAIVYL